MTKITKLLNLFGLGEIQERLFEVLFYSGSLSASELAKRVGISRTSAYDLLDEMIKIGLITESQAAGIKIFSSQLPEKIELLLLEKEKAIGSAKNCLSILKDEYLKKEKYFKPRWQIFEGQKEVQQMMKDLLLYRNITVYAFWPIQTIIKVLTPEFLEIFHQKRAERNITIKAIWPKSQMLAVKQHAFLQTDALQKRQARVAPTGINFSLGYAIYGNTVRFISSSKENFGFLVESQELAQVMKGQWQMMWEMSKSVK